MKFIKDNLHTIVSVLLFLIISIIFCNSVYNGYREYSNKITIDETYTYY